MCGLVGVFGVITPQVLACFEDLLNLDLVRGVHSTGILLVKRDLSTLVIKDTVLPYQLMRNKDYIEATRNPNAIIGLMGHNRAATRGSVEKKNAHPFEKGNIILAHNGTLHSVFRLPDNKDYEVDSENIAHAINKVGIKEAYKLIHGPAALTWWDKTAGTMNFVSNHERPFHYCMANSGSTVIWSSDEDILKEGLGRRGMKVSNKGEIYKPLKNRLYTLQMMKKNQLKVEKADLEEISFITHTPIRQNPWQAPEKDWGADRRGGNERHVRHVHVDNVNISAKNIVPFSRTETNKGKITEEDFHRIYHECLFCGDDLKNSFDSAVILDDRSAACADCAETAHNHNIRIAQ